MGWIWLIPAFHINPDTPTTKILLTRKEVDFPLGVGAALIDVEISLSEVTTSKDSNSSEQPPERQTSRDEREGEGEPEAGIAATLEAVVKGDIGGAVEVRQAAED